MKLFNRILLLGGTVTVLVGVGSASAHHSFAMFAMEKEMVLTGVATEFQWTNPHVWVEMNVEDANGAVKHWSIEGGPVSILARQGWKRSTIKPGDKISVVIHPLRTGEPGGSLMGVVTADGRTLGAPLTATPKP